VARNRDQSGAALVEFALLLPVFMALILGMFSGGVAYNQKLDVTHATREGARYGATVAVTNQFANGQSWASNVRDLIIDRASGDLSGTGTAVCVALVSGTGASTAAIDSTHTTAGGTTPCYSDNSADAGRRVQVSASRPSKVEALLFSSGITLNAKAESRYECQATTCQ